MGTEEKLNSRDSNGEIEIEKQESVQLNQDAGLRSRNSFKHSSTIEIPKIKVSSTTASPSESPKPVTPRREYEYDDDEDDDVTELLQDYQTKKQSMKITLLFVIDFILFVCIMLVLILSKFTHKLEKREIWRLEIWKWCVLALSILCGRMFSKWLIYVVIFLIEKELLLKKNALYFVYAAQKSIRVFIWLGLILLAWGLLINRSRHTDKILNQITRGIACTLIVIGAWILKTMLVKTLYSSFYEARYFDRVQENVFHQYIIQILGGPPLMKRSENKRKQGNNLTVSDVKKLMKIKRGKISAWTMRGLIKVVQKSDFYISCNELAETDGIIITNELKAIAAGYAVFENVAKHGNKYIIEDDLLQFMHKDEVKEVFALIRRSARLPEAEKINTKSVVNWVVKTWKNRRALTFSLSDTKADIKEINKFIIGLSVAVLIILWLILMGIASTEVMLFISSQFLLAVFSFGTTAKSAIEAIIFVFLKHPFDVGERCVIDGVQVIIEEMSILTTIVLRYDYEKIYYPNSVLATKAISNFNRSPDMSDYVDFDLGGYTSVENISALKAQIKTYINSKPHLWYPKHSVRVREIEDANKMKMRLYITHTINFQDYGEKSDRRSELVLKLKSILEELGIQYHINPQTTTF